MNFRAIRYFLLLATISAVVVLFLKKTQSTPPLLPSAKISPNLNQITSENEKNETQSNKREVLSTSDFTFTSARHELERLKKEYAGEELQKLMRRLSVRIALELPLADAIKLLPEISSTSAYQTGLDRLASRLAEQDPAMGLSWLNALPINSESTSPTLSYFNKLAEIDPTSAINLLKEINKPLQRWALTATAQLLAQKHPEFLFKKMGDAEFVSELDKYGIKIEGSLLSGVIESGGYRQAVEFAMQNNFSVSNMQFAVTAWAQREPEKAAEWFEKSHATLPIEKIASFENLVMEWSNSNSIASSEWLSHLPAGILRDYGAKALSKFAASKDGATASQWVESISNPELKSQAAKDVYAEWSVFDEEAANNWFNNTNK